MKSKSKPKSSTNQAASKSEQKSHRKRPSGTAATSAPTRAPSPIAVVSNGLARLRGEFVVVEMKRREGDAAWVREYMEKVNGVVSVLVAVHSFANSLHAELAEVHGLPRAAEMQAELLNLSADLLNWSGARYDARSEADDPGVQALYDRLERGAQIARSAHIALASKRAGVSYGQDGSWLVVAGRTYHFAKAQQAHVIQLLTGEWERSGRRDGLGLHEKWIGEKIGSASDNFRIQAVFRQHDAIGTVLRKTGKGQWALFLNA